MDETIPAFDYRRELATYRAEIDAAVSRVLDSGWLILGEEVTLFEQEFAAQIGVKHAIGVASGTDALILALRACGIQPGDEVVSVANTAVPTVSAIRAVGALPRFIDVDPATLQMCPVALAASLSSRTRCVVPVHLHGHPAEAAEIQRLANSLTIPVIGDCAQAFGSRLHGREVGTFADISCYSFYPTKNLGALGDGGMCVTDCDESATKLRELRQYGFRNDRIAHREGVCSRLDELQAAMLRVRLRHFAAGQQHRQHIARQYLQRLAFAPVQLPVSMETVVPSWHQFVVRSANRDALCEKMKQRGVGFGIHYPVPIHLMPAYEFLGYTRGSLPVTEHAAKEILSLPMFPGLRDDEIERVINVLCQ